MLARTIFFLISVSVSVTQVPTLIEKLSGVEKEPVSKPIASKPAPVTLGTVVLKEDKLGHFRSAFRINGKTIDGMIDTGASTIAINEATARRLGFGVNSLDFKYPMSTANGKTMAAYVKLDRVEIGAIRVQGVDAFVLKDNALSSTLIGMSFLKQLSSFKVADGEMRLVR